MKLLTFADAHGTPRTAAVTASGTHAIDLAQAAEAREGSVPSYLESLQQLLDAGQPGWEHVERLLEGAENLPAAAILSLDSLNFLAPLPRPRSIRDCLAFEQHLVQATRTVVKWKFPPAAALDRWLERRLGKGFLRVPRVWRQRPVYYKGNPHSVVGHEADVIWPSFTDKLDFELEFGVYIGKRGTDIAVGNAQAHIAGYTLFNDFSARDVQLQEMAARLGPAKSKDFDTGNAMGPYLVTPDEVPDPLNLRVSVNSEVWAAGSSREMHFSFDEIIAYISQSETLLPGDFIGSGTVPGGCGLEQDRWLRPGDIVELEADSLGRLRNRVTRKPQIV